MTLAQPRWRLSAYTIALPHMTPEEAVTAVKAAGYEGIEWSVHFHDPEPSRQPIRLHRNDLCFLEPTPQVLAHARRLCESAGLQISGLGLGGHFNRSEGIQMISGLGLGGHFNRSEGIQQAFELAEISGSKVIRIQAGQTLEGQSFAEAFESSVRLCDAYAKEAAHHDVKVVLHQHWGTATASASSMYRLLSRFDPRHLGCIYDPGNMFVEGHEDYRLGLGMLRDYVAHVHLKNVRYGHGLMVDAWHREWAPLDDGLVDYRYLFAVLDEIDYRGWIVMSDVGESRDEKAMLRHNHAFLLREMSEALAGPI